MVFRGFFAYAGDAILAFCWFLGVEMRFCAAWKERRERDTRTRQTQNDKRDLALARGKRGGSWLPNGREERVGRAEAKIPQRDGGERGKRGRRGGHAKYEHGASHRGSCQIILQKAKSLLVFANRHYFESGSLEFLPF